MHRALVGVAAVCIAFTTRNASAELGARLEYTAPPGCPDQAAFEQRVRERLLSESIEPTSLDQLVVRVFVEPRHQRARVELQGSDGARVERTVEGRSCEELVSGVALITALAFGAHDQAKAAGAETEPEDPVRPEQAPKPPEPAAKALTKAAANPRSSKLIPLKPPPKSAPRVVPRSELPSRNGGGSRGVTEDRGVETIDDSRMRRALTAEVGAGGWISTWLAPARMPGVDAFARLGARGASWSARASALFGSASAEVEQRRAVLGFFGGRLEGCPVGARLLPRLSAEACAAAELGALRGAGQADSALREASEQTVFWGAAVLLARARSALGPFVLEAQVELGIPVTANEFVFQNPEQSVYEAPDLGAAGRLGIGVPFL